MTESQSESYTKWTQLESQSWFYTTTHVIYELTAKPVLKPVLTRYYPTRQATVKKVIWQDALMLITPVTPGSSIRVERASRNSTTSLEAAIEVLQRSYDANTKYNHKQAKYYQQEYEVSLCKNAKQMVLGTNPQLATPIQPVPALRLPLHRRNPMTESQPPSESQPWFYTCIDAIYELVDHPRHRSTARVKKVIWKRPKADTTNPGWSFTIYGENHHLLTRSLEEAVEKLQYIYDKNAKNYLQQAEEYQKMHEKYRHKDAKQIVFGTTVPTPTQPESYTSPFTGETQ